MAYSSTQNIFHQNHILIHFCLTTDAVCISAFDIDLYTCIYVHYIMGETQISIHVIHQVVFTCFVNYYNCLPLGHKNSGLMSFFIQTFCTNHTDICEISTNITIPRHKLLQPCTYISVHWCKFPSTLAQICQKFCKLV